MVDGLVALFGVALAVTVGVIAVVRRRPDRDEATRRAFRRAQPRRVAEIREGELVMIVGTVSCDEPVRAPLTGRACAYWEVVEAMWDEEDHVWVERGREHAGVDFSISDGSGEVMVRVDGAEVLLMKTHDDGGSGGWCKREGAVLAGRRVAVAGRVSREPDPRPGRAGSYRELPTVLVIRSRRQPLRITDSPAILERAG